MPRRVVVALVAIVVFGASAGLGFLVVNLSSESPSVSTPATTAVTVAAPTTATTPTTQPRPELPDFKNFTFPAGTCEPGTKAVKVVNGRGGNAETDPPEIFEVKVSKSDLDRDGFPEAVVHVTCDVSSGQTGGREVAQIWSTSSGSAAVVADVLPRTRSFGADTTTLVSLSLTDRTIGVVERVWGPDEARCCSTVQARLSYTLEAGRLKAAGTPTIVADDPNEPANAFVVGVTEGYGLGEVAKPGVRDAIPKDLVGGEPKAVSCELEGDVTSECNGTIVTKDGTTRRIRFAFAPDLPPDAQYVDGEILRGGKPFTPARSLVIDFTAR